MDYRNRASTLVFRPACSERSHRLVDKWMARRVGRGCSVLRTLALWNLAESVGRTAKTIARVDTCLRPSAGLCVSIDLWFALRGDLRLHRAACSCSITRHLGSCHCSCFASHSAYWRLCSDRSRSALAQRPLDSIPDWFILDRTASPGLRWRNLSLFVSRKKLCDEPMAFLTYRGTD